MIFFLFFERYGDHLILHVLPHSSPTRRSSDLASSATPRSPRSTPIVRSVAARSRRMRPTSSSRRRSTRTPPPPRPRSGGRTPRPSRPRPSPVRSEEHTSELQSLMRTSYAVFRLNKKHPPTQKLNDTRLT